LQPLATVPCPRCGRPAVYAPENKWRPFCSERCRTIDLGNWAAERYRVPEPPQPAQAEGKDAKESPE
jgi:endogenous inhibitor of DNA gyrase (YacG/DUF329 family)